MSKSDWELPQLKAMRSLLLAASGIFVVFYGCYGTALAEEFKEQDKTELSSERPLGTASENISQGTAEPAIEESTRAEDLEIPSRFGASFSSETGGFDEIIGVSAFVPLNQTPGDDITFLEGSVQLTGGDPSFSLNVGYRDYDIDEGDINDVVLDDERRDDERDYRDEGDIHGGYLGLDARTTDESTFYQIAAGYEYLEEDWEFRANGYLPIGDRTRTIQDVDDDTNVTASSRFAGDQLVLSAVGERQRIFQQENSLGGLDLEVGHQLDEWYGGELRGYLGAYWLSGKESAVGVRGRLAADFESNFNAGLSLQHDELFGTSVGFSVSASLPGVRFHDEGERSFQEANEVVVRLRDPIVRRPTVAINLIEDSETIAIDETAPLRNPEEEEDYRFVHVDLAGGAGTGDGTAENPFGSVEDAIALAVSDPDTYSDGNTVVYVDGESAPAATIPGFTIPDRVRVISQGPQQTLGGMSFPGFDDTASRLPFSGEQNFNVASESPNANGVAVPLPNSGDGVFPTITGGASPDLVTLNNNTVLAGFNIQGATGSGVVADGVDNLE
ncbi:MAG: hypothetical protein AAFQ63_22800, partial [Cyanobacteria bacterium J06621_11]